MVRRFRGLGWAGLLCLSAASTLTASEFDQILAPKLMKYNSGRTIKLVASELIITRAACVPATPTTADTVVFSVDAADAQGQLASLSYDYGDGVADALGVHRYSAAGVYNVTVIATTGTASTSASLSVTVSDAASARAVGDADDDLFSDAVELAAGSDPNSAASRPFDLDTPAPRVGLTIQALNIGLNFATIRRDNLFISGTIDTFFNRGSIRGKVLIADVGGVVSAFSIDRSGTGALFVMTPRRNDKMFISVRPLFVRFQIALRRGDMDVALADDGLTQTAGTDMPRTIPVTVILGNEIYTVALNVAYSAVPGRIGRARLVR